MGCSGSVPIEEVNYDAIPACEGKPAELTFAQLDDPISGAMPQFAREQEHRQVLRVEREGAVCEDVCRRAMQGMELVCAVTKPSAKAAALSMPGALPIMFGAKGAVETRPNTTICWYRPLLPADESLDTVSVKEKFQMSTAYASKGLNKQLINSSSATAGTTEVRSGIEQTILTQASRGYGLKGASVVSTSTRLQIVDTKASALVPGATVEQSHQSNSETEVGLLFQRKSRREEPTTSPTTEAVVASYAITKTQHTASGGVGGQFHIETDVPDIIGHLNEQGQHGWALAALVALPAKEVMESAREQRVVTHDASHTTFVTTITMLALLERRPEGAAPVKHTAVTYTYKFSVFPRPSLKGDATPTIAAYAERGWIFKGMVALPAGMKDVSGSGLSVGMGGQEMRVLLFFAENDQRWTGAS